jgi:hypothetical protein
VVAARGLSIPESPFDSEIAAEEGDIAYLADVYLDFEERVLGKDVEEVRAERRTC